MIAATVLAAVVVAAFAWYAPRRAPVLPPRTATWLLTIGALVSTVVVGWMLALLAATAIAQLPFVAALGRWSRPDLRSTDPVPIWAASVCAGALLLAGACGARHALRRALALRRLHRDCRALRRPGPDRVVVVDSAVPEAYATTAAGGRIVVTTGMLAGLSAEEQRALLAHEAAHLRHRHVWLVLVADLCAAAIPALRAVAGAVAQATERWADESAAAAVGDRGTTARALARAALRAHDSRPAHRRPASRAVGGQIPQRVRALLAPPPRPRRLLTAGLTLLLAMSLACTALVQRRTDAFFDLASTGRPAATAYAGRPGVHHQRCHAPIRRLCRVARQLDID